MTTTVFDLVNVSTSHDGLGVSLLSAGVSSATDDTYNVTDNVTSLSNLSYITTAETISGEDSNYKTHERRIRLVYFYSLAIILPVGIICNCLTALVFCAAPVLRKSTTGQYLVAMATADTLVLIGEMLRWGSYSVDGSSITGYRLMHNYDVPCKLAYYMRYSFMLVSSWITVAITAERFITVAFPLRVSSISTPVKARLTILVIWILGIFLGSYPLWTIHSARWGKKGRYLCQYKDYRQYQRWELAVQQVGDLILPGILILILTALIIMHLTIARRRRSKMDSQQSLGRRGGKRDVEQQLTVMLVAVATTFIVLRLPYTVSYYVDQESDAIGVYVAKKVFEIFFVTNYAINFFLYCLSGSAFRNQLMLVFRCSAGKKQSSRYGTSMQTKTTSIINRGSHITSDNSLNNAQANYVSGSVTSIELSNQGHKSTDNNQGQSCSYVNDAMIQSPSDLYIPETTPTTTNNNSQDMTS